MKITFISTMEGFQWGGSEELWFMVAEVALNHKHQVQICTFDWGQIPNKIACLIEKGATVVFRKTPKNNLSSKVISYLKINQKKKYVKEIIKFNPDNILISQGATFDFFESDEIYNLIMKLNKPYSLISQFNIENGYLKNHKIQQRVNFPPVTWSKFYFVSQRNLEIANKQVCSIIKNTQIVSNPANIRHKSPCNWPLQKTLQMACVARYDCNYKGQDILLAALSLYGKFDFKIDFYGSGPDEASLQQLIKFYGLENKAILNKHVLNIDEIWENHHLLVLPSISEGTPLSLQEAMIKGRPALVTDVGGNSTLVIDGRTGFLAEASNISSISKKLEQLFNTSLEELKIMGENAAKHSLNLIDFESHLKIINHLENV